MSLFLSCSKSSCSFCRMVSTWFWFFCVAFRKLNWGVGNYGFPNWIWDVIDNFVPPLLPWVVGFMIFDLYSTFSPPNLQINGWYVFWATEAKAWSGVEDWLVKAPFKSFLQTQKFSRVNKHLADGRRDNGANPTISSSFKFIL